MSIYSQALLDGALPLQAFFSGISSLPILSLFNISFVPHRDWRAEGYIAPFFFFVAFYITLIQLRTTDISHRTVKILETIKSLIFTAIWIVLAYYTGWYHDWLAERITVLVLGALILFFVVYPTLWVAWRQRGHGVSLT